MIVPFLGVGAQNHAIRGELRDAFEGVIGRGMFVLGEEVNAFEHEFAQYCCAKRAVGVASGLDALKLLLMAYGIGPGDEVIAPANTYIATWMAVTAVGAKVVPVDANFDTMTIDCDLLEGAISERTKAIIPVHLYGRQVDLHPIASLAARRDIRVIVDAAQAHGLKSIGDSAAFSFYPTKNLGCLGDGGAIVTNDYRIADEVLRLRNYGAAVKNVHVNARGLNSRLDEMQAAFLRVKLKHLDAWNQRRCETAAIYHHAFRAGSEAVPPLRAGVNVWHQYVVRCDDRLKFRMRMSQAGVCTEIHYPTPPHLQDAYGHLGYLSGRFPVAESIARTCVSMPIGHELTPAQVDRVAKAVMGLAT